ncbi:MAG: hypothetical protein P8H59_10250 [Flavobacteriales bacterium]|nr:hypothetical protein [Flavobacteriales bacterium]MDG1781323.1 hypothetical protein [Flavobacteriales bacterium]MDG2245920.1 hypothetical protein [Flavobacteriales bacterium]
MMKRHDDPFFEMFREGLQGYEATPPAGAHAAIKSKVAKGGGFFHFSWNRLNVYYASLMVGAGLAAMFVLNNEQATTPMQTAMMPEVGNNHVLHAVQVRLADANQQNDSEGELVFTMEDFSFEVDTYSMLSHVYQMPSCGGTIDNSQIQLGDQLVSVNTATEHQEAKAEETTEMQKMAKVQLPIDWTDRLKSPNMNDLITQLDSDSETIFLKVPVKVTVEN